jgi:hypothetical protein
MSDVSPLGRLARALLWLSPPPPSSELLDQVNELRRAQVSLHRRLDLANGAMREASRHLDELKATLEQRIDGVERLREAHARHAAQSEAEEAEIQVLIQRVRLALGRRRLARDVVVLAAGLLAGYLAGSWHGPAVSTAGPGPAAAPTGESAPPPAPAPVQPPPAVAEPATPAGSGAPAPVAPAAQPGPVASTAVEPAGMAPAEAPAAPQASPPPAPEPQPVAEPVPAVVAEPEPPAAPAPAEAATPQPPAVPAVPPVPVLEPQPPAQRLARSATDLRLRAEPSIEAAPVVVVKAGSVLVVLEVRGDWARVRSPKGNLGWVYRRYLRETGESPPADR